MKERIDQILVKFFNVLTRSQANDLIKRGQVLFQGQKVKKAGLLVESDEISKIELLDTKNYVGRGAYKLEHALKEFRVEVQDKIVADVGASTGGFTQVLLQQGASKVFAIDVGHGQLHPSLKLDSRVVNLEGINIKEVNPLNEQVDLVVVDLSFISLAKVWNNLSALLKSKGNMLILFKPQFEVEDPKLLDKGILKDKKLQESLVFNFLSSVDVQKNFSKSEYISSPILGKDGNREFLLFLADKL